jgi:DNA-binding transcriptional ArsR family regulator
VLCDPTRRRIVELLLLGGEDSVRRLARDLPVSRPTVSRHLRVLVETGFVRSRAAGPRRMYCVHVESLAVFDAWLEPYRPLRAQRPRDDRALAELAAWLRRYRDLWARPVLTANPLTRGLD